MFEKWFTKWEHFWADLPRLRLVGFIECLYGVAILARPHTGTAGMIAGDIGVDPAWFGWAFLAFGLPALLHHWPAIGFVFFAIPIHLYTLGAIAWVVRGDINPSTSIAANMAVLILLYSLGMQIARGNHDG